MRLLHVLDHSIGSLDLGTTSPRTRTMETNNAHLNHHLFLATADRREDVCEAGINSSADEQPFTRSAPCKAASPPDSMQ